MQPARCHQPLRARRAFTLIEVVLAILILAGILSVLLYFYHRATQVRQAALHEAEFVTTARLLMDRMTAELRAALPVPDASAGFEGASNSVRFVFASLPSMTPWLVDTNSPVTTAPATDLKTVFYGLAGGTNFVESAGIERTEGFLGMAAVEPVAGTNSVAVTETNELTEAQAFLEASDFAATNMVPVRIEPLTDKIRFLQFRYWTGLEWTNTWSGMNPPQGVEISLGRAPMPEESAADGYPDELFRRVVYLPGSSPAAGQSELAVEDESW